MYSLEFDNNGSVLIHEEFSGDYTCYVLLDGTWHLAITRRTEEDALDGASALVTELNRRHNGSFV